MKTKRALIIYDPAIVKGWTTAVSVSVDYIFRQALQGRDYPRERGILSIEDVPADESLEEAEARAERRGYAEAERDIMAWLRRIGKPNTASAIYDGAHRMVTLPVMTLDELDALDRAQRTGETKAP
ncbi:hypothetical protein [Sphingobium lignivorans]|uniref:Uncharacterized protein n=1 Tax=Sphingobium lignivorans TaxID=2735886 RepID=A0ABR6NJD3_9SPHN|nr:hypothetical protein [Sphingobium lignivorans]MBB5987389.1 hypothetical protein [Sphingobium lignivorans]